MSEQSSSSGAKVATSDASGTANSAPSAGRRLALWKLLPLAVFMMLSPLLYWGLWHDSEELPSALAGKPLPEMALPSLLRRGETVSNAFFTGHWTLINVWGSWCPTCYIEHPYLHALAQQGVRIVGLNYKDEPDKARDYLARLGNPYVEVALDESGQYGMELGVYGAPETFVIDPEGNIVLRYVGELNERSWAQRFAPVWPRELPHAE